MVSFFAFRSTASADGFEMKKWEGCRSDPGALRQPSSRCLVGVERRSTRAAGNGGGHSLRLELSRQVRFLLFGVINEGSLAIARAVMRVQVLARRALNSKRHQPRSSGV